MGDDLRARLIAAAAAGEISRIVSPGGPPQESWLATFKVSHPTKEGRCVYGSCSSLCSRLLSEADRLSRSMVNNAQPGDPYELVQALGTFPAALPATGRSDGRPDPVEERRLSIYRQLVDLGDQGLPALLRGLVDPDVQIRRNVALFLGVTGSDWGASIAGQLSTDKCLPALITALRDTDERVRHLAAQAIGSIGPKAASAVPALVELLKSPDEGSRNSACVGLGGIGPPARAALPALRDALSDSSPNVRRFAQRAIEKIEVR